jgi:signal peptidase I
MSLDFSLILVLATALSGAIWALDAAFLRGRRASSGLPSADGSPPGREPVVVEYARSFFPILLIVLLVRSFLFEPFRIPSSSMMPTLLIGDFIFVNKYTYGLRLPVTNTRVLSIGEPARGDVVVFRLPADPGTNYIKRLVGLPGDSIRYINKQLFINGVEVNRSASGRYQGEGQHGALLYREELGERGHDILLMPGQRSLEGTFMVPDGHYFMMGDNRDNSRDSRYRGVGLIPEDKIVGKAVRIWMNWQIPGMPRWSRVGDPIY